MSQCKSVVLKSLTLFNEIQVKDNNQHYHPKRYNTTAPRNIARARDKLKYVVF